jgi:hypothetical protein
VKRGLGAWILMVVAVIVLHDGSMAFAGHTPMPVSVHHGDHGQHDEPAVPEQCGTVRLVSQRLSSPEPPDADAQSSLGPAPYLPIFDAISEPFLVVPVVPPPSACLAWFQVFRI